jgi:histidinol-phosphate aminotransferase
LYFRCGLGSEAFLVGFRQMNQATDQIRPRPRPGIMDIEAYVPGKSAAPAGVKLHKLSSNENPLGASPKAIEAARAVADRLEFYPDLGKGDEGIYTEHGFLAYPIYIQGVGAVPVVAKENGERADVGAILAAVTPRTKIVFLANPNNPTGTYLPFEEVRRLHAGLPKHVLLVIDAAYAEFVRRNDYEAGVELVAGAENVVMTRTFSKVHGLGGARIGWIYAPAHIVEAMERVRDPFNVNALAIEAGVAAMRDRTHVERSVAHVGQWLPWLTEELTRLGLRVTPSVGNFILIHFPEGERHSAAAADEYLSARGYILRRVAGYGFPNALRMTVGTEEANRGVVAALTEFLKD